MTLTTLTDRDLAVMGALLCIRKDTAPSLPKPIRPAPEVLARIMQSPVPRKESE